MDDQASARLKMVDSQLRTEDVTDYEVLAAMGATPRELFVPAGLRSLAYIDEDILVKPATATSPARYLMEPSPFARLVQAAEIAKADKVLVVGCGTGYSAAVLARLAASVVALESDPELAGIARGNLRGLGVANATVVVGPLEVGHPPLAPYDVILLEGAVEILPDPLFEQLRDGGRLVAVVGHGRAAPAMVFTKDDGDIGGRPVFNAGVRPLPGFHKPKSFVF